MRKTWHNDGASRTIGVTVDMRRIVVQACPMFPSRAVCYCVLVQANTLQQASTGTPAHHFWLPGSMPSTFTFTFTMINLSVPHYIHQLLFIVCRGDVDNKMTTSNHVLCQHSFTAHLEFQFRKKFLFAFTPQHVNNQPSCPCALQASHQTAMPFLAASLRQQQLRV